MHWRACPGNARLALSMQTCGAEESPCAMGWAGCDLGLLRCLQTCVLQAAKCCTPHVCPKSMSIGVRQPRSVSVQLLETLASCACSLPSPSPPSWCHHHQAILVAFVSCLISPPDEGFGMQTLPPGRPAGSRFAPNNSRQSAWQDHSENPIPCPVAAAAPGPPFCCTGAGPSPRVAAATSVEPSSRLMLVASCAT